MKAVKAMVFTFIEWQSASLINELNSTLIRYRYDSEQGIFEELQTVPALPHDFNGENLCADIHVSPDGSYLDASNRGHDSIVCFFIDQDAGESTAGREPRNFAIDPSGAFLLVANQKTNSIITFRIEAESGGLSKTGHGVEVPMPICLKFAHLK